MTEKNIWKEIITGKNKQHILEFLKMMVCLAIMFSLIACLLNTLMDYKLNNIPCDKIDNPNNLGLTLNSSIDNICNYTFINTASYYKYHGIDGVLNISFNGFLEGYQRVIGEPFTKLTLIFAFLLLLMAIPEMEKRIILSIKRKVSFIESALIKTILILILSGICLLFPILMPIIYCILCIISFGLILYGLLILIIPAIIGLYWHNYNYMNSIKYNKKNKKNKNNKK